MAQKQTETGQQYYTGFSGYDLPLNLEGHVSKEQAEARGTYLIAHRDDAGRLQEVKKVHDGALWFTHQYIYDASGALIEARITDADGKTSMHRYFYDTSGIRIGARITGKDGRTSVLKRNSEGLLVDVGGASAKSNGQDDTVSKGE